MSVKAKVYLGVVVFVGLAALGAGLFHWETEDLTRFIVYALIATLASGLKVSLPGITGTMSVLFLFILVGIVELSLSETLAAGCAGAVIQCFWRAKERPKRVQVAFNVANMATAITLAYFTYHWLRGLQTQTATLAFLMAAGVFFVYPSYKKKDILDQY